MHQTSSCLQRLCAQQLSQTGRFVLDIGDYEISLGEIQKNIISTSSTVNEVLGVYEEIDAIVEKYRRGSKKGRKGASFYSVHDLNWFAKDAYNMAVKQELLGDDRTAAKLYATSLNLVPMCGQDIQCYQKAIQQSFVECKSRRMRGDSSSVFWNLLGA